MSESIKNSDGVNVSYGVNRSYGVNVSNGVNWSDGVNWSYGVNRSDGVNVSYGVNVSNGVNWSDGVNRSDGVNGSYGVLNKKAINKCIFPSANCQEFTVFGSKVSEEKFNDIWINLYNKLNGWKPVFNNAFELFVKNGNDWKKVKANEICSKLECDKKPYEAWKTMPSEAIDYLKSLPEFDPDIFEYVTGIKVDKTKKIIIDGRKIEISEESFEELKKQLTNNN